MTIYNLKLKGFAYNCDYQDLYYLEKALIVFLDFGFTEFIITKKKGEKT